MWHLRAMGHTDDILKPWVLAEQACRFGAQLQTSACSRRLWGPAAHRFMASCPAQAVLKSLSGPVVYFPEMRRGTGSLCVRATQDPFMWEDGVFRPLRAVPQSSLPLRTSQVTDSRGLRIKGRLARPRHGGDPAVRSAPGEGGLRGLGESWEPGGSEQRRRGLCSYFLTGHRGPMLLCTAAPGPCWVGGWWSTPASTEGPLQQNTC